MNTRKASSAFALCLSIGFALAIGLFAPHASAQNKFEVAAKALQKKAMEEDYLTTEFAKAQDKLDRAIAQCGTDKCNASIRALLRRDLGVVLIGGQIDKDKGIQSFVDALKIDAGINLDPDTKTKDLEQAFSEAKKRAAGGGSGGETPSGDFTHTPAAEQQIRTAIPVYAEYSGEEPIVKALLRYKGFGMTDWKSVDMKKMGDKGWGALIPCGDVQQGSTQYYLQGFNAANDPIATGGDRNHPYKVAVKREKVAEPPHLPNEPPPSQCADTGDCPPNFPGCKKAPVGAEPSASTEPTGKDGGEFCEEDNECKSNVCKNSKCTDYQATSKYPKMWVGVWGAVDFSFLPSADEVCKLKPTNQNQEPFNDQNYYCTSNGDDYPYRLTSSNDTNPRAPENTRLVTGTSDKVSGGTAVGNVRVGLSFDYAVNMNVLVGVRVGYVLLTYPGQAAKDDGKTFPPIHLEVRGTYLIGKDALTLKLAPYGFVGAGVSTWDSAVKVTVLENTGGTRPTPRDVDGWHIGGPAFVSLGGGLRVAFTPKMALMGGARVNFAFGNSFAPSVGPEVGLAMGF